MLEIGCLCRAGFDIFKVVIGFLLLVTVVSLIYVYVEMKTIIQNRCWYLGTNVDCFVRNLYLCFFAFSCNVYDSEQTFRSLSVFSNTLLQKSLNA